MSEQAKTPAKFADVKIGDIVSDAQGLHYKIISIDESSPYPLQGDGSDSWSFEGESQHGCEEDRIEAHYIPATPVAKLAPKLAEALNLLVQHMLATDKVNDKVLAIMETLVVRNAQEVIALAQEGASHE